MQSEAASLPAGEEESAGHVEQVLSAVAPLAAEYLSAPQLSHAVLPSVAWCLPAGQPVHAPLPVWANGEIVRAFYVVVIVCCHHLCP